jgi:hypothetical protein
MSTPIRKRRFLLWLHDVWQRIRVFTAVLAIIRFNLLIPALLAAILLFADQMIDILRAVGEDERRTWVAWLLAMAAFAGLVVWYSARTMLRFIFAGNPASVPTVHPQWKRVLPRVLGVSIPAMLTLRVFELACTSTAERTRGLWVFTAALALVTALVGIYVFQRRRIAEKTGFTALAASESNEKRNLTQWRELPDTSRRVLIALLALNVIVLLLFMWGPFYAGGGPVTLGAPAILLLGLGLTTVGGSIVVYIANHHGIPIILLLALWTAVCSVLNDNHMARVVPDGASHGFFWRAHTPAPAELKTHSPLGDRSLDAYFKAWFKDLADRQLSNARPIPVFIVSAEGGGLRAAYWTAMALAQLEDDTANNPLPFSRHVIAISGVSGGSVGAALFDASVASRIDSGASGSRREEIDTMLKQDFLSDTLGAMLFPDLLQRFLPLPVFNDRAIALDQSFERAWAGAHPEDRDRFKASFHELWRKDSYRVPLLFFNSTVVETGQRAINTPTATLTQDPDPAFTDTLSVGRLIGTELPLSTAALLSARFTYVSPVALIDTHGQHDPNWIRLADGGYFDNSGAVTAQEIARALVDSHLVCGAGGPAPGMPCMRLIVLHLPNEPEPPTAVLNAKKRNRGAVELMSEVFAPVQTLLNTRGARGTQAVSFLRGEPKVELLALRPCTETVTAPLGWVLSAQVRSDMAKQLTQRKESGGNDAGARIAWVDGLVNGDSTTELQKEFSQPAVCPAAKIQ